MSDGGVGKFFKIARDRYQIMLNRQAGLPKPWSKDPVFQTEYFCNCFREDDRTTEWFRENIRDKINLSGEKATILLSIAAFRWFNRIATWETLLNHGGRRLEDIFNNWDSKWVREILIESGKAPWVTGAYIMKTPDGMDKLSGVLWCIDRFIDNTNEDKFNEILYEDTSLEKACSILQTSPYLGKFTAWQICSDARFTKLLENAPDKNTWAQPGPGSARGLGRVFYTNVNHFQYGNRKDAAEMLHLMQLLVSYSRKEEYWPQNWPTWAVIDISHQLCEFDKYERCEEGGRMKRKYNAT